MAGSTTISLAIAIASLALVSALTLPSLTQYLKRIRNRKAQYLELADLYDDKDGVATEESESNYTDFVPRLILVLVSTVGALDALIFAIIITTRPHLNLMIEQWLQFGTWMLLIFQVLTIFFTKSSVDRYNLGFITALSSLAVVLALATENISLWQASSVPLPRKIHLTLSLIQWISAVILMFTGLSIPRRPDVYRDGQVVDRQNTVSLLSKLTFTWPAPILRHAAKTKGLDYTDIPDIDHHARSQTLRKGFESVPKKDKLWKTLFLAHKSGFLLQWLLQAIVSITNFLPQIALYFILRTLEARDSGENVTLRAWLLVIALGSADATSTWVENWMFYVSFCRVGTPVYEQLTTVVFGKAIRRKDVKGAAKGVDDEKAQNGHITPQDEDDAPKEDINNDDDDDDTVQKTRQSIVNLAAVDAKRIAEFANFNYIFLGSVIKLTVAIAFLIKLIGFIPMLAGFVAPAIITPLNVYVSRRYARAQDDLMKHRDQKMAVVTEALQGIRQIKFSALEKDWYEKILQTRNKELNSQWTSFLCDTCLISIWIFGPVMLSAISLMVYAVINKELSASVAFTTISVFEAIEMTLAIVPEMFTDLMDSLVSARRIQNYLDSPEREDGTTSGQRIEFSDATIAWPSDEPENEEQPFALRRVDLKFPQGELSTISGPTGAGKSLLLSSIIGEAEVLEGKVTVPRPIKPAERYDAKATKQDWILPTSVAYVAQIPWIENATIKDNVLFGLPMDDARYKTVVSVCALEKDLEMLEDGDLTDIGANGINLSGGQKWRVSFARALYSRAGILVLDDIFSAVDANVGRHLYEKALTGELGQGRTRILVTHHVALTLPKTKYSVLLADGGIEAAGDTEDLRRTGKLESILAYDVEVQNKEEAVDEDIVDDGGGLNTVLSNQSRRNRKYSNLSTGTPDLQRKRSHATIEEAPKSAPKRFTEEEGRETGAIRWNVYSTYIRASGGYSYWGLIAVVFAAFIAIYLARSYWISIWTRSYRTESTLGIQLLRQPGRMVTHLRSEFQAMELDSQLLYYLGVYLGISLLAWIVGSIKYFFIFLASIRASKVLFEGLAFTVLRAPLRWLDTVPVGRVLNRFTADFNMLDSKIAFDMSFFLHNTMHVVSVIIAGVFVSPFMIIFAVILLALSAFYAGRYLAAAREIKRLESNAKSPVFEQIGSVLTGIATIRAFDKTDTYVQRMYQKVDLHCRCYYFLMVFNRWMSFRLNVIGAMFAVVTAALVVSIPQIDASLAGFALSFALSLAEAVIWMLRQYTQVELDSNATERIIEYSTMPTESQGGVEAPAAWPTKGELEVEKLVVGYAADLPPVLKGLTFNVKQNERVGVVGRTGAGKSSLTLALFRFLEARSGSIHIDGIDISKIKLHDLRSRLAIIPQDPVLFSGTVRSNLDPFDQHTDLELREALARVHLIASPTATASGSATPIPQTPIPGTPSETNKNIFRSLSSKISEGGLNLSQGQRQLLCLARAIVSRPKIMVLDEATSAVDMDTDALIQRSIREEFGDSTLLVIAHRLSTIADFDRILVMGEGEAKEFGSPRELLGREGGVFRNLVEESGERGTLEGIILGEQGG